MPAIPLSPPDLDAAAAMWSDYAAAHPDRVSACPDYTVEQFGDHVALAEELLGLVIAGRKRATSDLVAAFADRGDPLPRIGSHWIACDGGGAPRAILRSTEFRIGPFDSVDETFARDEGEDDGSVTSWREAHRRFWERVSEARGATWSEADEIVFERFQVVWPPSIAD